MKVFHALNLAALFTGPAGVLLGVAGGIAVATAAVVGFVEATRDGGPAVRELTVAARELNTAMEEAGAACEDTTASALAAADVANTYIDKLEAMGDMANASDEEQKQYQNTLALLLRVMPELSDCISTTTDEYGRATYTLETTTEALRANTEEWKRNAKAQAYQEYLNTLMEQYNGVMLEAAENEIGLTKARYDLEAANQKYNGAIERMNELWSEAQQKADEQYREYGALGDTTAYLTQEYYDLQYSLVELNNEIWEAESSVTAHEKAIEKDAEAVAAAEVEMSAAEQAVNDLTEAMGDYADGQADITAQESAVRAALGGSRSGRATVQAYIDQAEGMLPQVRAAYKKVATAAVISMGYIPYSDSAYHANGNTGIYGGFASGTENAPPGWSWVGEDGPELMRMHGGEQILPSHVSQEVARTYRAYNKYSGEYEAARAIQGIQSSARPALEVVAGGQTSGGTKMEMHFHIEAGASPETVNAWQDYASRGELKAVVLEVMEEADADMKRRVIG